MRRAAVAGRTKVLLVFFDYLSEQHPQVRRLDQIDRTAIIRLLGTVFAEQHDEWTEARRYMGLDVLAKCRTRPVPAGDTPPPTEEVHTPAALNRIGWNWITW